MFLLPLLQSLILIVITSSSSLPIQFIILLSSFSSARYIPLLLSSHTCHHHHSRLLLMFTWNKAYIGAFPHYLFPYDNTQSSYLILAIQHPGTVKEATLSLPNSPPSKAFREPRPTHSGLKGIPEALTTLPFPLEALRVPG